MTFSRVAGISVFLGCLLGFTWTANPAVAQTPAQSPSHAASTSSTPSAASTEAPAILPEQFAGWQMQGSAQVSTNAALADPSNAAILKEYRFTDFASSTYTRDDGRTLKIRAARFADTSGAFGAYTFYVQPEMNKEEIGDQGSSLGPRVLFYRGYVLVDAQFSKESPMSASELRDLAGVLPRPRGSLANLPGFIEFMPHRSSVANTQKYVMGPAALATMSPPISADLVDFGASAEVTLERYNTPSGEAMLMLISYPTNQMAADHLRRIDPSQSPKAGVAKIACTNAFCYKRTGPFIAIAAGPASNSDVKSLLGMVNYEATVTWNENTYFDKNNNIGALLVNIIILCFILGAMAIVAGVAFGGFRILMKRWFPDKLFDRPEQMEFISLRLTEVVEVVVEEPGQGGPEGVRQTPQNRG